MRRQINDNNEYALVSATGMNEAKVLGSTAERSHSRNNTNATPSATRNSQNCQGTTARSSAPQEGHLRFGCTNRYQGILLAS